MERGACVFALPLIIPCLCLPSLGWAAEQAAQKWEYKVIRAGDFEGNAPIERLDQWQAYMDDRMNELGKDGWELVSVSRGEGLVVFFFKRYLK